MTSAIAAYSDFISKSVSVINSVGSDKVFIVTAYNKLKVKPKTFQNWKNEKVKGKKFSRNNYQNKVNPKKTEELSNIFSMPFKAGQYLKI